MSKYEKIMAQIEILKVELEVLKARYEIGHIDRDAYRDDVLRIDSRLSNLMVEVLNTHSRELL